MDEIESRILDAWRRIRPRLVGDSAELRRRLGRCGRRALSRPPRAWCLAIRASDRRLVAWGYGGQQQRAVSRLPAAGGQLVFVDVYLLRDLCRRVEIGRGGETWERVAGKLGVGFTGLINARLSGRIRARHVRGLLGRFGPPVPVLSSDEQLDPNARGFAAPDPVWGWTGSSLAGRVPEDFEQHLTRVPVYHARVSRRDSDDAMHPEARDSAPPPARARLAPPEPDHVWYKWSTSGEYLGDDPKNWRKSPDDPGTPPAEMPVKPRRKRKPRRRVMRGSLAFRGWAWVCPKCGKKVRVLYLPAPPLRSIDANDLEEAENGHDDRETGGQGAGVGGLPLVSVSPGPRVSATSSFACYACHRVRAFSRVDGKNSWNELVSYLSGGLLFGHEVAKPAWFADEARRKAPFRPRARAAPRREQVLRRMLNGWTITQIAGDLGMCRQQVCDCIRKSCRQEGVSNRRELARKLGSAHFQPMDSDRKLKPGRHTIYGKAGAPVAAGRAECRPGAV